MLAPIQSFVADHPIRYASWLCLLNKGGFLERFSKCIGNHIVASIMPHTNYLSIMGQAEWSNCTKTFSWFSLGIVDGLKRSKIVYKQIFACHFRLVLFVKAASHQVAASCFVEIPWVAYCYCRNEYACLHANDHDGTEYFKFKYCLKCWEWPNNWVSFAKIITWAVVPFSSRSSIVPSKAGSKKQDHRPQTSRILPKISYSYGILHQATRLLKTYFISRFIIMIMSCPLSMWFHRGGYFVGILYPLNCFYLWYVSTTRPQPGTFFCKLV